MLWNKIRRNQDKNLTSGLALVGQLGPEVL